MIKVRDKYMKEYMSEIVSVILGLLIPICWSLIKTHFRAKQNEKDISENKEGLSKMNVDYALLKDEVSQTKIDVAVIKETTSTIKEQNKTLLDLFQLHIVNKK